MWADTYPAYLATYEVRLHRRTKTFGGITWPPGNPGPISEQRQLEIAIAARKKKGS